MPKFQIEIEETLQRVEEVEAKNLEEAINIIDKKYNNQEIVLDSKDFKGHEIREITKENINVVNLLKELENKKVEKDFEYSKIGNTTLENHNIFKFQNIDKTFDFIYDYDVSKEELVGQLSKKMKEDLSFEYANERLIKEDGKYYYGEELYLFEKEIKEKAMKIKIILNELNIKDTNPYDIIELLEQAENLYEPIEEKLIDNISNTIKLVGYKGTIQDFINHINEELTKEQK